MSIPSADHYAIMTYLMRMLETALADYQTCPHSQALLGLVSLSGIAFGITAAESDPTLAARIRDAIGNDPDFTAAHAFRVDQSLAELAEVLGS